MSDALERAMEASEAEEAAPTECGDPLCAGHIDETTGCCVLCGVEHTTPCGDCEQYGFHSSGCPERDAIAADLCEGC